MMTRAGAFIILSCAVGVAVCTARAQTPSPSSDPSQDTFSPGRPAFKGPTASASAPSSEPTAGSQPAATGSETEEVTVNGHRPISVREGTRFYIETQIPDAMEVNMAIATGRVCADENLPMPKRLSSCDMAIWKLRGASMENRELATIYVARAGARQQSGNDPAAIDDYKAAAKLDPSSPRPWLGLGNLYAARGDYSHALSSYDRAVTIAPDDPVIFDNRGAALERLGHHDEALASFSRAIRLDPKDLSAYSNRATVYRTSQREDLAIADLTEVIRADSSSGQAYYDRGTAYELSGDLEKAKADYRETVRRMPSFAPATAALGRLDSKDDPELALAEFGAAIRLDPKSPALRARALLYLSLAQPERALPDLDRVITNDGSDAIAWANRGVAKSRLGDVAGAIADCSRAIELAPTVLNRVNRGNAYATLHRDAEALADFDMALQMDPGDLPALLGRANANYASRRLAASLEDYTRVIALDPHGALNYFKRGNIHLDLKEFGPALSDYSESLKIDPNQAVVLLNRSIAAARLGHRHDAALDQERALALDPYILDGGPDAHKR
jgi:tetratricopeptide (TPR) repeat protein